MLGHGAGIGYTGPGWAPLTISVWWRGRAEGEMFPIRMRKLDNISVRQTYIGKLDSWAFGDIVTFKIKVAVYEKLSKK